MDHTKILELADELDVRYGNPYAAKQNGTIQQAIIALRELVEENRILTEKELNDSTTR